MPKMNNGQKVKTMSALKIDGAFGLDANNRLTYTSNGEHSPTLTPEIVEYEQYGKYVWAKDVHGIVYTNDEAMYQAALKEGKENIQSQNNDPKQAREAQKEAEIKQYQRDKARAEKMADIALNGHMQRWKDDNIRNNDGIQRRDIPMKNVSILHPTPDGSMDIISPRNVELLHNAPVDALQHIDEPWAAKAFQSYLDSRAVPVEDWNNTINRYGITMDELKNGMHLVCNATFLMDGVAQQQSFNIPHLKGASIDPDTGVFKMNSRSIEFTNVDLEQNRDIRQNIHIDVSHQYLAEVNKAMRNIQREDPHQAWLDSFSRDKDSPRRTIHLEPSVKPEFTLTTPNGDRFSVTATHLSIMSATSQMSMDQMMNLNDSFNQQRWQHSLNVRGCTEQEFYSLLDSVGMTIGDLQDGLHVEMTALVCDDNGEFSKQTFDIDAKDVFVDRNTGEFIINDKTTKFEGKDKDLADRTIGHDSPEIEDQGRDIGE